MHAQITILLTDNEKVNYAPCETIKTKVIVKSLPETCTDGMKRTKIFVSGMDIINDAEWKQKGKGCFEKYLILKIHEKPGNKSRLTIKRKTDKEELFKQKVFNIQLLYDKN